MTEASMKMQRLENANRLIASVSTYGRRFFYSAKFDRVARFDLSSNGKLWLWEELADVVICADLIAMDAGIDLDAAVQAKFNATSEKVGLATRMSGCPHCGFRHPPDGGCI